jgi:hypothetical protein
MSPQPRDSLAHLPKVGTAVLSMGRREHTMTLIETDTRSRVVIPGHPNERFLIQENSDGSLLLQPARVLSQAQAEYDDDVELRSLLARAAGSPTVHRRRSRRPE